MKYFNFVGLLYFVLIVGCTQNIRNYTDEESRQLIQNGDIIFHISQTNQSEAIRLATGSVYSHMGIVYMDDGEMLVYEAVQPVKLTPFDKWTNRGKNGHYVVKRLKIADDVLTEETLEKMKDVGSRFKGKDYDIYFEWSDDKIYCSELVWKIYYEATGIKIGELEHLSEFDLSHEIVRQKMQERFGDQIPENEQFISPAKMFDSKKLKTVVVYE